MRAARRGSVLINMETFAARVAATDSAVKLNRARARNVQPEPPSCSRLVATRRSGCRTELGAAANARGPDPGESLALRPVGTPGQRPKAEQRKRVGRHSDRDQ